MVEKLFLVFAAVFLGLFLRSWVAPGLIPACVVLAGGVAWGWTQKSQSVVSTGLAALLYIVLSVFGWPISILIWIPAWLGLKFLFSKIWKEKETPAGDHKLLSFRRGHVDRTSVFLAIAFAVVSGIALVIWRYSVDYDFTSYQAHVPDLDIPIWLYFVGLWPYAAINALFEELLFRGILHESLNRVFGKTLLPLVIQALSFGVLHFSGFPGGYIGAGLATVYGLFMGILYNKSDGLLVPWAAHLIADVVIYSLVVAMVFG